MEFGLDTAEVFVPDGLPVDEALSRTTHLAVCAHQDDLEIMAAEPIIQCYQRDDKWYTGCVVTDGRGSPRTDIYADYTDDEMHAVRFREQKKAAYIGEFAAQVFLDYPSSAVKDPANTTAIEDIANLIKACSPEILYTHNLADKHDTHMGVTIKTIAAVRTLAPEERPKQFIGCEVWRNLDWLVDADKIVFNLTDHENLQWALLGVFDSQITGGKRYDVGTMGRRKANATYFEDHGVDTTTGLNWGIDYTPLLQDDSIDPADYIQSFIDRFAADVQSRIAKVRA